MPLEVRLHNQHGELVDVITQFLDYSFVPKAGVEPLSPADCHYHYTFSYPLPNLSFMAIEIHHFSKYSLTPTQAPIYY